MENNKEKNINLRCEMELFEQFSALCSEKESNISLELRTYMKCCVECGDIVDNRKKAVNTSSDFRDSIGGNLHSIPACW